ncbi:MAG TPA: AmmeMemoRadiSam system radical SAM enzyme [Candidatus Brocadiia bacterium]|nr:AmmeMemoRadiSam system radical SAM enzyme [Candidatus Brocadiia bacterium]
MAGGKGMAGLRDAEMWRAADGGRVECYLCAHRCVIADGKRGVCDTRLNQGGRLKALTWGQVVAANVDPIEKKPLYHFLPGSKSYSIATHGCNFKCEFCQNWQISQVSGDVSAGRDTPPEAVVNEAFRSGCRSVSYTYTEPTMFFEYAMACGRLAHERGLRNCFVTNGYQTPETVAAMTGVVDAANVDIKAFNDDFYRKLCKARLQPALDSVKAMVAAGVWVEVTTLLIPRHNDREDELKALAEWLAAVSPDLPWHVSRYHPDYQFDRAPATPPETVFRAAEIGRAAGLRYVYAGNLRAGEWECTRCPSCQQVVIRRDGFWVEEMKLKGACCAKCGAKVAGVME